MNPDQHDSDAEAQDSRQPKLHGLLQSESRTKYDKDGRPVRVMTTYNHENPSTLKPIIHAAPDQDILLRIRSGKVTYCKQEIIEKVRGDR